VLKKHHAKMAHGAVEHISTLASALDGSEQSASRPDRSLCYKSIK